MANTLTSMNGKVPSAFAGRSPSGMLDAARAGVQASFAVIGYRGRSWRLKHRGTETLLRDGQGRPMSELDVVVVGVAPSVAKTYYAHSYVEGDDNAPDCFSLDGVAPDAAAPKPQNPTCGNCKHNQWGSRVTDAGKRAKACQDNRRMAVVPLGDIANESLGGPMMLRIPPTSLPNLANYADFLTRKGADFPWVATRLTFDSEVAYPKIEFNAIGFLSDEQGELVAQVMDNPLIDRMLRESGPTEQAPAQGAGGDLRGKPPAAMGRVAPPQSPAPLAPAAAQAEVEDEDDEPAPNGANPFAAAQAAAQGTAANPFAGTAAGSLAQGAAVQAAAAPAKRTRRVASATQTPAAAPADLETAIEDLLT